MYNYNQQSKEKKIPNNAAKSHPSNAYPIETTTAENTVDFISSSTIALLQTIIKPRQYETCEKTCLKIEFNQVNFFMATN